jgi:hypothetical protein
MPFRHGARKTLISDFLDAIQAHRPPMIDGRWARHALG